MKNFISIIFVLVILITSCTENSKAKNFGGETTINLPKGQKLVNVTWKETNMWYLTKPMMPSDSVETYTFHEESSFGVWEGTVRLVETR